MPLPVRDYSGKTGKSHTCSPTEETWFRFGVQKKIRSRLRNGKINCDDSLDLHGYRRDEALARVKDFLDTAYRNRKYCVKIIFGSGYRSPNGPVLKPAVQSYLCQCAYVNGYAPTLPGDGGHGAAYVLLKRLI